MAERKRAPAEFEATQSNAGPQVVTLDSLVGGYNGYTSPDLLSPQFWAGASNVYAGQFGAIRRARWAPVLNFLTSGYTPVNQFFASLYSYFPVGHQPYILTDYPLGAATLVDPMYAQYVAGVLQYFQYSGFYNLSQPGVQNQFPGPFMR